MTFDRSLDFMSVCVLGGSDGEESVMSAAALIFDRRFCSKVMAWQNILPSTGRTGGVFHGVLIFSVLLSAFVRKPSGVGPAGPQGGPEVCRAA